jgi:hypothetical protein
MSQIYTQTKTFKDSDSMNLKGFADDLFHSIQIDNLLSENSVVVSLNAKFGMGKSYFLEMFENYLIEEKKAETILINSWKNDFCDEPLIAICCELFSYFEGQNDEKSLPIREQLKSIVSIFGDLSNQFLKAQLGIDLEKTVNKNKSINHGKVIFEKFNQKKDLFEKLYKSIAEYTAEKQLIILIDELDRTRPDYAVNFLETLKHFFDIKGLIFILAVNKEQLKQSVECIYGKIDFDEYYRKFAHRDVALPYSEEGINKYIIKVVDDFFNKIEVDGKKIGIEKNSLKSESYTLKAYIKEFFTKLKLSPRQINQFFRVFLSLLTSENKSSNSLGYQIASIVYIAIDLYDSEIAKKILNDQFKYIDFLDFIKSKKIDLSTTVRLVSYLLFLFSNTREEVNQNKKICEENFNIKIESAHEPELNLGGFNETTISPIKNVGKKISQSKKLFGQS